MQVGIGDDVRFKNPEQMRGGGGLGTYDEDEREIRMLPVIWRVLRDFPETRKAVEAALDKQKLMPVRKENTTQ